MSLESIFGFISAPLTQYIKNRADKAQAKHNREMAVINNGARLARNKQSHNHEWEMEALRGKDRFLQWFSFSMLTGPILITMIKPERGAEIFTNLESVPEWWVQIWVAVNGAIWGISSLKTVGPQIVQNIKAAWKSAK